MLLRVHFELSVLDFALYHRKPCERLLGVSESFPKNDLGRGRAGDARAWTRGQFGPVPGPLRRRGVEVVHDHAEAIAAAGLENKRLDLGERERGLVDRASANALDRKLDHVVDDLALAVRSAAIEKHFRAGGCQCQAPLPLVEEKLHAVGRPANVSRARLVEIVVLDLDREV